MARRLANLVFSVGFFLIADNASAQLTITEPTAAQAVIAASASKPIDGASLNWPGIEPTSWSSTNQSLTQIRVKVRYLLVDGETRKAVYRQFNQEQIRHITPSRPIDPIASSPGSSDQPNVSTQQMFMPLSATTCVLSAEEAGSLVAKVSSAAASEVKPSPSILLLDGNEAEMNDLTQHPFVIGMQPTATGWEPTIQIFDCGTQLRVRSTVVRSGTPAIDLVAELVCSRIDSVSTEPIFGVGEEPKEIQIPLHSIKTTIASESVVSGSVLLIDPHFRNAKTVRSETPVPMVSKLPYVGQNFKSVQNLEVQQYLLLMLEPEVVKN